MNKFFEISVIKNPEVAPPIILGFVFQKFHRVLALEKLTAVGVSFPEHRKTTLGNVLRVHGNAQDLDRILTNSWLADVKDYVSISDVQDVPMTTKGFRSVRRIQKKTPFNHYKRAVRNGKVSMEEAERQLAIREYERPELPFLKIKSYSNGNTMPLFVKHCDIVGEPVVGQFNSYGFSPAATIPWF